MVKRLFIVFFPLHNPVCGRFREAASKGLSLVDLLARRYDVVAANPPYMGSKNMGSVLKHHIERQFSAGKRDLYLVVVDVGLWPGQADRLRVRNEMYLVTTLCQFKP